MSQEEVIPLALDSDDQKSPPSASQPAGSNRRQFLDLAPTTDLKKRRENPCPFINCTHLKGKENFFGRKEGVR
jgi:hypothetical protein